MSAQQQLMDAARARRQAAKKAGAIQKAQALQQRNSEKQALDPTSGSSSTEPTGEAPARLRRAEAILQQRTGRFALVLERVSDSFNQSAVLRSAEAFGIQHIFIVEPAVPRNESTKPLAFARQITKNCHRYEALNLLLACMPSSLSLAFEGLNIAFYTNIFIFQIMSAQVAHAVFFQQHRGLPTGIARTALSGVLLVLWMLMSTCQLMRAI